MRDDELARDAGRDATSEGGIRWPADDERRAGEPGRGRALLIPEVAESGRRLVGELARAGFSVRVCSDAQAGLAAFLRELPDLIVAAEGGSGVEEPERLRALREIADVPVLQVRAGRSESDPQGSQPAGPQPVTADRVRRIARSELEAELRRQLVECRGNLAEMARRMGKDRSTIRYHLRRFGMLADEKAAPSERAAVDAGNANDTADASRTSA